MVGQNAERFAQSDHAQDVLEPRLVKRAKRAPELGS